MQKALCTGCKDGQTAPDFTMAFQPIVDIETQRIVAHEALVRGLGGEGAKDVLSRIDKTNVYAFDQACRTRAIGLASRIGLQTRLNINFLPNAVYEPAACIRATLDAAARTGFPIRSLTFEMVENEDVAESGHLRRIIETYRRIGFGIALDDFGTGYSGLARLAELQPDTIKVDRALVMDCDRNPIRRAILANVVALGREIGTQVVLEGVERVEEVEALRAIGGRFMQGYFFARPAFEALVSETDMPWAAMPLAEAGNG